MATVLIAEPDPDACALLVAAIRTRGHAVRGTSDAFAALAAALEDPPAVLIAARTLPKGRPADLLERMRRGGCAPRRAILLLRHGDAAPDPASGWGALAWPMDGTDLGAAVDGT